MSEPPSVVTIRPRRAAPVLVCRKCLKRLDDGREIKQALKSELKRRSAKLGNKRPRVVLTSCFDICPKRAVVVASGATLNRGEYLLLADSDGIADAAEILMRP
jgi:predicted metal-binding protein